MEQAVVGYLWKISHFKPPKKDKLPHFHLSKLEFAIKYRLLDEDCCGDAGVTAYTSHSLVPGASFHNHLADNGFPRPRQVLTLIDISVNPIIASVLRPGRANLGLAGNL